jgi:cyanate lyase
MERTVTLEQHNLTVRVKELTVADIRSWLRAMQDMGAVDVVNAGLFDEEGASIDDVLMMTDLDREELEQLTPAEVSQVIEKCKRVNPHFFRFRAAMVEYGIQPPTPASSEPSSTPPSRP